VPTIRFGNHCSVIVPRQERAKIQEFYGDVLGGSVVLYGDVPDSSEFQRTAHSVWLELKTDDVEAMKRRILESGLVRQLDIPDPHLYFQAPGGQCWRLVGVDEDLSFYEGAAEGPNVARVKEALRKESTKA
jgi:hypothetical protein